MKLFIVYDPTGNIIGRYMTTDNAQADKYAYGVDIDNEDYTSKPEQWAEVDIITKKLRPKFGAIDPTNKGRRR